MKNKKLDMGDRMKSYEKVSENVLTSRLPVILRLDGNSFSKFTKKMKFQKPFDSRFDIAMNEAARAVLEYCSGAQIAYIQSDEITILLRNDQTHETSPFLGNRTQKISSLCAAKASVAFNDSLRDQMKGLYLHSEAVFDCRVFTVPPAEVNNVFLWRQQDCYKNFVSGYAYWEIGKKLGKKTTISLLDGKSTRQRVDLIKEQLGIDVNTDSKLVPHRTGRTVIRNTYELPLSQALENEGKREMVLAKNPNLDLTKMVTRSFWAVQYSAPRFNEQPNYINDLLENE